VIQKHGRQFVSMSEVRRFESQCLGRSQQEIIVDLRQQNDHAWRQLSNEVYAKNEALRRLRMLVTYNLELARILLSEGNPLTADLVESHTIEIIR